MDKFKGRLILLTDEIGNSPPPLVTKDYWFAAKKNQRPRQVKDALISFCFLFEGKENQMFNSPAIIPNYTQYMKVHQYSNNTCPASYYYGRLRKV